MCGCQITAAFSGVESEEHFGGRGRARRQARRAARSEMPRAVRRQRLKRLAGRALPFALATGTGINTLKVAKHIRKKRKRADALAAMNLSTPLQTRAGEPVKKTPVNVAAVAEAEYEQEPMAEATPEEAYPEPVMEAPQDEEAAYEPSEAEAEESYAGCGCGGAGKMLSFVGKESYVVTEQEKKRTRNMLLMSVLVLVVLALLVYLITRQLNK